ncbi:MAG TPA: FecR family protein, partial [Burkholderiaceae bacterium]
MRGDGGIRLRLWRLLALLCLLACCISARAATPAAPEPSGKIDLITGELQILQAGKPARAGHAGEAVYEGDILATGKDSEAHLTMADAGFIVLRTNTRMQIFSYKADGGEQDNGVLKLFSGAMRSISGWIGKYNRRSYLVRTPTATIGIRGTDHETRYIPPGSSEGEAGTYDKVFIGETTIQSDTGQAMVDPNQAGFAANQGEAQPKVLSSVPAFFRPGPHEELINRKHAEIQKMIEQRREERRKILEQKRAEFQAARLS